MVKFRLEKKYAHNNDGNRSLSIVYNHYVTIVGQSSIDILGCSLLLIFINIIGQMIVLSNRSNSKSDATRRHYDVQNGL